MHLVRCFIIINSNGQYLKASFLYDNVLKYKCASPLSKNGVQTLSSQIYHHQWSKRNDISAFSALTLFK